MDAPRDIRHLVIGSVTYKAASSDGCCSLPIGATAGSSASMSPRVCPPNTIMGVYVYPGATPVTRMPLPTSSAAAPPMRLRSAALDAA